MVRTVCILVVDDNELMAMTLQEGLRHLFNNCRVAIATNGQEALRLLAESPFDLLITDYQMPQMDGLTLANRIQQLYSNMPVVIVSGFNSARLRREAALLAIRHVLTKPVGLLEIREVVLDVLRGQIDPAEVKDEWQISEALEQWISLQASNSRPDLRTREVMDLLDQWSRRG